MRKPQMNVKEWLDFAILSIIFLVSIPFVYDLIWKLWAVL